MSLIASKNNSAVLADGAGKQLPGQALEKGERHAALLRVYEEEFEGFCVYAGSMVGSPELAQDIVQQAFANTLSSVERGTHIHNEAAFLTRCIRNLAFDHHKQRHDHKSIDEELPRLYERFSDKQPPHLYERSPSEDVEYKEQWRELATAVDDLIPSQRRAFLLAELRGLGYEEIATRMDRSTDSVRMLLNRARHRVRAIVNHERETVGSFIPFVGAERFTFHNLDGAGGVFSTLRAKVTVLREWLGTNLRQNLEILVQQGYTPFVAGTVVVAISTTSLGSLLDHKARPDGALYVQRSDAIVRVLPLDERKAAMRQLDGAAGGQKSALPDRVESGKRDSSSSQSTPSVPTSEGAADREADQDTGEAAASGLSGNVAPPARQGGSGDGMHNELEAPGHGYDDPPSEPILGLHEGTRGNIPDGPCGNFPNISQTPAPKNDRPGPAVVVAAKVPDSEPDRSEPAAANSTQDPAAEPHQFNGVNADSEANPPTSAIVSPSS